MRICEIYQSKQGEGFLTGTESWFVRTSGCNLRCWFCDTSFSSWKPEGRQWTHDEILNELDLGQANHVVLTGGEPMLPKDVVQLTDSLKENGFHITIETAGTVFHPVQCDLMSISPKLANSTPSKERAGEWAGRHEAVRHQPDVIRKLVKQFEYQIKFVVDAEEDCQRVEEYLNEFPEIARDRVLLMPQGVIADELAARQAWLEPYCMANDLTFCPRKHIEWYGNKRGT